MPGRERWKQWLGSASLLALALWRRDEPHGDDDPPLEAEPAAVVAPASLPPPARPQGLLWIGCDEVEALPRAGEAIACGFTGARASLRLWLPSSVTESVVTLDGAPFAVTSDAQVDDGRSLLLQPDRGGRLTVVGKVEGGPAQELLRFDLRIRPRSDEELRTQLDAAVGDREGQARFVARLRAGLAGDLSPEQRLLHTRYLQYALFDMGEPRESVKLALDVADMARAQGELILECSSRWGASFVLGEQLGDERAAAAALVPACGRASPIPSVAMMGSYYEALGELRQGRYEDARRLLEGSVLVARRVRWSRWEIMALNSLIAALASQGRFEWARQALERLRELDVPNREAGLLDRCESQAHHWRKLGDLAARERELVGTTPVPPVELWLRARAVLRDRALCPEHPSVAASLVLLHIDLARAALEEGELDRAAGWLARVPHRGITPLAEARRRLLRAELELARGAVSVAQRRLEQLAHDIGRGHFGDALGPEDEWRVHLARARVHLARGERPGALAALARAQARLDERRAALPGVESDRHAAMRRRSSQLVVRLLLDHGQVGPALCEARVARARGMWGWGTVPAEARRSAQAAERSRAALYEGYAWYDPRDIPIDERMRVEANQSDVLTTSASSPAPIACDLLPVPSPGEASLLYHHDGRSWVGFAWDATGRTRAQRLPPGPESRPPAVPAEALLSPFAEIVAQAARLRVLVPPVMRDVSFADVEWDGRRLGEVLAVAHAIDLPRLSSPAPAAATATLVFSDPHKALMGRYDTLVPRFLEWGTRLEAKGFHLAHVIPPSRTNGHVSVREVMDAVRGVELALLYGFGSVHPTYYDRMRSAPLAPEPDQDGFGAGADVLTRADVLLGGPAPRHVILAHCDSATVDPSGLSGAVGLAQSYVHAGAEWALGAMGDVDPRSMEAIVDDVLEAYPRGSRVEDVAAALERAKLRLEDQGLPDGEALRLWVP